MICNNNVFWETESINSVSIIKGKYIYIYRYNIQIHGYNSIINLKQRIY